jgi:hypothetical protein
MSNPNLLETPAIAAVLAPLSMKERTYVVSSTIGMMPKTQAAAEAGYKNPPTAIKLRAARNVIQDAMMEELEITKEDIQTGILEAIQVGRVKQEGMTMLAGWRDMAKLLGFLETKAPDLGQLNLTQINFNDMSELSNDQLRALAAPVLQTPEAFQDIIEHGDRE